MLEIVKLKMVILVVFDYTATVDEKPFKGSEGKNTQLHWEKIYF